ncbi:MAG: YlxR family protein [Firmicutes bacterium]|nr:YlxR family protein [Candidatus Alectryobacillus merdavium]
MKKEILRKCISTGEIKNRNLLFRIVKTPTGDIKVDFTYRANGRGAYISKNKEAIENAKKKKLLSKALECNISDEIYDYLLTLVC